MLKKILFVTIIATSCNYINATTISENNLSVSKNKILMPKTLFDTSENWLNYHLKSDVKTNKKEMNWNYLLGRYDNKAKDEDEEKYVPNNIDKLAHLFNEHQQPHITKQFIDEFNKQSTNHKASYNEKDKTFCIDGSDLQASRYTSKKKHPGGKEVEVPDIVYDQKLAEIFNSTSVVREMNRMMVPCSILLSRFWRRNLASRW